MTGESDCDLPPIVRVTDGLGHDLPSETIDTARAMLGWLALEELAGELSPGLEEVRDLLRKEVREHDA